MFDCNFCLFLGIQLTVYQHGLVPNRQQAFTSTNDDQIFYAYFMSSDLDDLIH